MSVVVDQYFPILEAFEGQVVELEEVILGEKFIQETTSRIYNLKRELLSIKRARLAARGRVRYIAGRHQPAHVGGYAADLKLIFKFLLSFVEAFEEVLGGHFDFVRPTQISPGPMPNDRKLFGQACDHALEIMVRHGFVVHFKRARSPSALRGVY